MDVTVYLPNEIGEKAKAEGINLSGTLRAAVQSELARRKQMRASLGKPQTYELRIEDKDGNPIIGRITGKLLEDDIHGRFSTYLTDDERLILYDDHNARVQTYEDANEATAELDPELYPATFQALGVTPVIDL